MLNAMKRLPYNTQFMILNNIKINPCAVRMGYIRSFNYPSVIVASKKLKPKSSWNSGTWPQWSRWRERLVPRKAGTFPYRNLDCYSCSGLYWLLDTDIFCYLCFVLLINYISDSGKWDTNKKEEVESSSRALSTRSRVPLIIYSPEPAGSQTTSITLTFKNTTNAHSAFMWKSRLW